MEKVYGLYNFLRIIGICRLCNFYMEIRVIQSITIYKRNNLLRKFIIIEISPGCIDRNRNQTQVRFFPGR